uniref:SAM domain-containing protein n=1 Tax=Monodelphis domestica TaxID=13616 RepID=A0A5F8GRL9_MONDO
MALSNVPYRSEVLAWGPDELAEYFKKLNYKDCEKVVKKHHISGPRFLVSVGSFEPGFLFGIEISECFSPHDRSHPAGSAVQSDILDQAEAKWRSRKILFSMPSSLLTPTQHHWFSAQCSLSALSAIKCYFQILHSY